MAGRKTFPFTNAQLLQALLHPPKRTFPYPPVPHSGNTVSFILHTRHRNANTSVCKSILRSQVRKGTTVLFLKSPFSQGKLNWHELLKTSWAICSRPCGNRAENWSYDSYPLCKLQGLCTDQPSLQTPACFPVSHLSLTWKHRYSIYLEQHLPQPVFTVISTALLSHSHDHRKVW